MIFKINQDQICYFCAGARNHSLLDFFNPQNLRPEYDERMASFKALGLTKMMHQPVIICTTSGTAVTQTLSALLEAKYSHNPLVLISGDRPKKMHGTGAPQTINHREVTENCVAQYIEVNFEELADLEIKNPKFPLHINVLINDTAEHELAIKQDQTLEDFYQFSQKVSRPLVLISHENKSLRELTQKLKNLNLNLYCESLSNARDLTPHIYEKTLIDNLHQFDSVIRIGHTPLSKAWRLLEIHHKDVFSFDNRNLSALSYGQVSPISGQELLENDNFFEIISKFKDSNILPPKGINSLLKKYPHSEMSQIRSLQDSFSENAIVYLGNSLVIRYFEMVQDKNFRVFGTRGINGIDGQISQAIGLAQGTTEQVYCIIGDMTAQYDLNAIRDLPSNLKIIIINNGGGRIFETLKLNPLLVMEHDFTFKEVSAAFNQSYSTHIGDASVIEVKTNQEETRAFLLEYNQ